MVKKQFAQQRLGWHRDARCRHLKTASAKWLNSVLWSLCVELRTDTLPSYVDIEYLAHESGVDKRTVCKGLEIMCTKMCGLIRINDDGTITVFGVREVHESAKFPFKDTIAADDDDINVDKNVDKNVTKLTPFLGVKEKKRIINKNNIKRVAGEDAETKEAEEILKMFPGMKTVNSWILKHSTKFSLVAILDEVKNAYEWKMNQPPSKKLTGSNPTAFLTRWLSRCQGSLQSAQDVSEESERDRRVRERGTSMTEVEINQLYQDWLDECKRDGIDPNSVPCPVPKPLGIE